VTRWAPVATAAAGAVLVVAVAVATGLPAGDAVALVVLTVGWAAVAGVAGAAALWALRRRSLAEQVAVVALTGVAAVAAGTTAAAQAMYVSAHDLAALRVILAAGGTAGVLCAVVLGRRVGAASRRLGATARRIGDGDGAGAAGDRPAPRELADLAAELDAMSARLDASRASERAMERSRRELVAWVSHDLRTPLAAIRAVTEALEDGVVTDEATVHRYHRTLREEADRLAALVDDLFELSRIQAGALRLEMKRAALADVVSDAVAAAGPVAEAKGVRLEGHLDGRAVEVELSTPEVLRALRNLLENAIRHTPADGTVWVEAGVERDRAYVAVADSCGGIADEDLGRVFEVAFRGEAARTPGDGRAGLGLAIAKGLVEAHDGEIDVANAGPGCRFTVRLPLPA
jgi:signal transduction histidine kinase